MVCADEQLSSEVNLSALDEIVKEYLHNDAFLSPRNFETDVSGTHVRRAIAKVRQLIEAGSVTEAMSEVKLISPELLQDQRVLFWLKKQEVIEHLRQGSAASRDKALKCLRTELAPLALNAYPEAYTEFKRCLLMLVYSEEDDSPVAMDWSVRKRFMLASIVSRILKHRLDAFDSKLCLMLKYLLLVFRSYSSLSGAQGPVAELVNSLLLPERDPQLPPPDHGRTDFPEADVQSLAQPLAITRQEAVNALRYTDGNAVLALKIELGGVPLATSNLNKIVWEYAMCRQLVGPVDNLHEAEDGAGCSMDGAGITLSNKLSSSLYTSVVDSVVNGDFASASQQLQQIDSEFFNQHPQVFFDLKQCHFYQCLADGQQAKAVVVARTELSSFVQSRSDLLPKLKVLLASLLQPAHPTFEQCLSDFSSSLHAALRQHFGLSDPALVQLLCGLLHAHKQWHKHQHLEDRFETELGIDTLKAKPEQQQQLPADEMFVDHDDSFSSADMDEDIVDEAGIPEQAILQTMEFSSLSRAEAIELLQHYGGDPQAVLMHLFP